jgi:site-specific recombinase XerD
MAVIKTKQGKKGLTYYIVYNQKVRFSDGTETSKKKWLKVGNTQSAAQQALRQFKKEIKENPDYFISKNTVLFSSFVIEEYLPWCKTRKTKAQFERTAYAMNLIINYFGNLQLNNVTPRLIEDYISWRKERPTRGKLISNRTVNVDLGFLSQCYKKAIEWEFIETNPCKKVKKLKENKNRVRFFTEEEIKKVMEVGNSYILRFFIVGISTGMRLQEILNLKLTNIDIPGSVIHIVNDDSFQTKNGRNRDVPISNFLSLYLQVYMKTFVDSRTCIQSSRVWEQLEYLFCNRKGKPIKSFKTAYKGLLLKAGIKNANIHTMRHTFASHLIMKGVGIRTVQELLGHSSISVTEMYSHLSTGFKKQEIDLLDFGSP